MYIQHVREAAERYTWNTCTPMKTIYRLFIQIYMYVQVIHLEKILISQYNVDIHKANTKNPIKDFVKKKTQDKKTKPK